MILCLTYHRISRDASSQGDDFYTVTAKQLEDQVGMILSAGFAPIDYDALASGRAAEGKTFMLTFDDGTIDHCEIAWPILEAKKIRGVFFVPTAWIGREGYVNETQVRRMSDSGQVIGCHSHEHKRMDTMVEPEMRNQLSTACENLNRITGKRPWIFAPPGGYVNPLLQSTALSVQLKTIRTMRWGFNRRLDSTAMETLPLNRHTSEAAFKKILQGKHPKLLYLTKQFIKRLIPSSIYHGLRGRLLQLSHGR
jgi:peptidoglycan/xylan/chitin deacetylase (PgdA/CDA1 family)